ncbi:hypothetical protein EKD16_11700 [Streptomonospora litoralis]|uniref:Uncharacterized protein n=1 Tax=Streptomonospora litoralis TaxID=2498135 RepID=A0A4P6Q0Z3_9ACTN|nr:hypothetical protein EKD16_11700 [Streptomonospora litoralis]
MRGTGVHGHGTSGPSSSASSVTAGGRVLAGGGGRRRAGRVCCAALLVCRVAGGLDWKAAARAARGGARTQRAGCPPLTHPTRQRRRRRGRACGVEPGAPPGSGRGPDAGRSAAVMRPDRGHEMHVRAVASASVPPRGAVLTPSFRDTKQRGVFCPPMPEFPVGPPSRCGGDGARGAPNGANTAPASTFRASRGRCVCRGRPQSGHMPPKAHPIGSWSARRPRPGATSDASSPPGPPIRRATGPCGRSRPRGDSGRRGPGWNTATPSRPTGAHMSGMPVHPAMIVNLWSRNAPSGDHKFTIDRKAGSAQRRVLTRHRSEFGENRALDAPSGLRRPNAAPVGHRHQRASAPTSEGAALRRRRRRVPRAARIGGHPRDPAAPGPRAASSRRRAIHPAARRSTRAPVGLVSSSTAMWKACGIAS